MEVSGKVTSTSKTNFNLYCITCDTDGLKEPAHGFCQDCQEHLCKSCLQHHRRSRLSRNHVLLDKDAMPTQQTTIDDVNAEVITDNCTNHRDKQLEFYCNNHKTVACYVCVTLEHKQCKVDYIPDVSGNISGDLIDLNKKMKNLVKKCENNIMKASAATKQLEQSRGKVVEDIRLLRKEINDRLDQMESMMIKEAEAVVNTATYKHKNITVACEKIAEDVKRSQSFLNALKEANKNNKLFIELKNVRPRLMTLESEEIQTVKENMTYDDIQFDRNEKLLDQLKSETIFGTISTYRKSSTDIEICVKYERSLNVTFPSDEEQSDVFGMVTISASHMILADYGNKKIKMIDVDTGTLVSEKTVSSAPWDVIKLPQNKLAVALPNEKCIQIMSYNNTSLTLDRRVNVGEECDCVAYSHDKLVVGCNCNPGKIVILDLDGKLIQVIDIPGLFEEPEKIVISSDEKFLYVADYINIIDGKCTKIDWQGNVVESFTDQGCEGPKGIQELEDGTLLVCFRESNKIVRLSSSFKKCEITGLERINLDSPQAVTFSERTHKLYVSCSSEKERSSNDTIKVFNMQYSIANICCNVTHLM
ncbi:E3 ubiquitin-protein ligase TRIM45-like [Ruditapes philippinarum]|uniref:E3 ubiquitin-protein ligase TRIM45-like n=1 Tax=Ruditapes philippinarum TaxID=129788 RepID=UPI00295B7C92|nr:E3 ubiquitin-protein ligase TRIM45-like [Ruditapes philippinarum]XP_060602498.1 E3 ubiquitin-protein ligase TRIM45-like [Ruditapes philippinarum]